MFFSFSLVLFISRKFYNLIFVDSIMDVFHVVSIRFSEKKDHMIHACCQVFEFLVLFYIIDTLAGSPRILFTQFFSLYIYFFLLSFIFFVFSTSSPVPLFLKSYQNLVVVVVMIMSQIFLGHNYFYLIFSPHWSLFQTLIICSHQSYAVMLCFYWHYACCFELHTHRFLSIIRKKTF